MRQKIVEDGSLRWFKSRSSMPFTSQVNFIEPIPLGLATSDSKDAENVD